MNSVKKVILSGLIALGTAGFFGCSNKKNPIGPIINTPTQAITTATVTPTATQTSTPYANTFTPTQIVPTTTPTPTYTTAINSPTATQTSTATNATPTQTDTLEAILTTTNTATSTPTHTEMPADTYTPTQSIPTSTSTATPTVTSTPLPNVTPVNFNIADFDGTNLAGAELSIYPASMYNISSGDPASLDSLIPKASPDAVTDASGNALLYLTQKSHIVVHKAGLLDTMEFNVQPAGTTPFSTGDISSQCQSNGADGDTSAPNSKKCELNTNCSGNWHIDGHLDHSEFYDTDDLNHGNKYVAGSKLTAILQEVNKDGVPHTGTFLIERCSDGQIVYYGQLTNTAETITANADSNSRKSIDFILPISWNDGKYKMYSSKDGTTKDKLIDPFFKIPDTTAPDIGGLTDIIASGAETYTGQNLTIQFIPQNVPQSGTVAANFVGIEQSTDGLSIESVAPDASSVTTTASFPPSVVLYYAPITSGSIGANSGYRGITIQATDTSGNSITKFVPVKVNVNKAEVNSIIEQELTNKFLDFTPDVYYSQSGVSGTYDRYSPTGNIYLKYRSAQDGSSDLTDFSDSEWAQVMQWTATNDANRIRGLNPGTANETRANMILILTNLGY